VAYLDCHYSPRTWLGGEVRSLVATSKDILQASICKAFVGTIESGYSRITNSHSEALSPVSHAYVEPEQDVAHSWKSSDVVLEIRIGEVLLSVVDCHSTLDCEIIVPLVTCIHQFRLSRRFLRLVIRLHT
jgi:hypothetical protein